VVSFWCPVAIPIREKRHSESERFARSKRYRFDADGARATNKAYEWGESVRRTFGVAHNYIIKHWHDLHDGDVVDVEWILGETKQKKISERVTEPL
jgi:hypothetical protein